MLTPAAGSIILDGKEVPSWAPKQVARELGLLPQTSFAPDGITVADLVGRGCGPVPEPLPQMTRQQ